jgi:hypothetical protein
VWREAAHVLPRAVMAGLSLRSLDAGCAGFYAGLSSELRDALVFARGDQAQCDAIITRRLIFLKDRCGPPRTKPPPLTLP